MIVTKCPDKVINGIQESMRRGITIINEAEGAYKHDKQTVLFTVVTRFELPQLETIMRETDPAALSAFPKMFVLWDDFMKNL